MTNKKIYIVSDAHLGIGSKFSSEFRENLLIKWLDEIKCDAEEIIFAGDIFDFWFEYKYLVPKGFFKFFTKVRELSDRGIKISFFKGNHDMWTFGYLKEVMNAEIIDNYKIFERNGKKFFIAHGDGLGPYDIKYNFLKMIFRSTFFQCLFRFVHPSISFRIATVWSSNSRKYHKFPKVVDYEKEWLVKYARRMLRKQHIDFFIFGHRHIPFQYKLSENSLFTNIGDWLFNFSYVVIDDKNVELKKFIYNEEN
ncbi:MAG: UDP-2,3-diacylglucosamine diphosphatase [Bacteroidales bacterium]|jgi:UDP-2,3-diacylglucosamine hydrolase|nr:UDP-2,3-diacylglucosamine diphosphatase [Bacteroidales bacterium]HOL98106.1 UDP-2,3-diacylglucosamine diphosphatase [Bacteroidales bacterium]HOM36215.1 UDP-2,3-diacylglucosamine diphosphatase [Bacteroidales bacterium]HPD23746.1 UDP-2,3-diacylglucosamine diphosphatase [Bacteroidales bacterium]HRS99776.1 UDP-2,3-diacylglucosamine diphosphatase [Bacteroidales bacterium]